MKPKPSGGEGGKKKKSWKWLELMSFMKPLLEKRRYKHTTDKNHAFPNISEL